MPPDVKDVLVHEYGEILYERICDGLHRRTCQELVRRLEALGVEELPGDNR